MGDALPGALSAQQAYATAYAAGPLPALVYLMLNALDSKASAMLRYDGIALAILALLTLGEGAGGLGAATAPALIALACFGAAAVACQILIWLRWLSPQEAAAMTAEAPDEAQRRLGAQAAAAVNVRSRIYRVAWILSFAGTAPLIYTLFLALRGGG
ncbi:MAG: hypothetical protein AAGI51_03795 [Pseudomonadota bacterium]